MIKPTIGRVVWYHANGVQEGVQPQAALVAYVHSDTLVNLAVFNDQGNPRGETSVTLYQGEGDRPQTAHAEWMPYQIGQAAKAVAAEAPVETEVVHTGTDNSVKVESAQAE